MPVSFCAPERLIVCPQFDPSVMFITTRVGEGPHRKLQDGVLQAASAETTGSIVVAITMPINELRTMRSPKNQVKPLPGQELIT
jgi:hypothetical protein